MRIRTRRPSLTDVGVPLALFVGVPLVVAIASTLTGSVLTAALFGALAVLGAGVLYRGFRYPIKAIPREQQWERPKGVQRKTVPDQCPNGHTLTAKGAAYKDDVVHGRVWRCLECDDVFSQSSSSPVGH
ncbi:MAG: hypothetical protein L0H59_03560 [Tomitella sp.]|nr:hypothetical protein [Tomitella sp.]